MQLPVLTSLAQSDLPHTQYVELAAAASSQVNTPVAIVGHSGVGVFLPAIAALVENLDGSVFVDAVVPPRAGHHRTPEPMKAMLDEQTVNGRLRPWLEWWPEEAVAELLPDPRDRISLSTNIPQLPRSFYDTDVAVSDSWDNAPSGYVRLYEGFRGRGNRMVDLFNAEEVRGSAGNRDAAVNLATHVPSLAKAARSSVGAMNDRLRREASNHSGPLASAAEGSWENPNETPTSDLFARNRNQFSSNRAVG